MLITYNKSEDTKMVIKDLFLLVKKNRLTFEIIFIFRLIIKWLANMQPSLKYFVVLDITE